MTFALRRQRFKQIVSGSSLLVAPGVYDGLSAKIAEKAGFLAVYASGGAIARSTGVPDIGLLTMTEVRDRLAQICDATELPVIADADTGYGNALNVARTVRELARVGVVAIQLEDQVTPKKCGHYSGKEIISIDEMCGKIWAALDARPDENLLIIARTDAVAVHGLEDALERGHRYAEAGADIIFVEAPESPEQIARIAQDLRGVPLLINMFEGGRTPLLPWSNLERLGYRLVIVPSDFQRAAIRAMQRVAATLLQHGRSALNPDELAGFNEREELVGKTAWDELSRRYGGM